MKVSLRVLAMTRYGHLGASSRMRTMQYLDALRRDGCDIEVRALLDDRYLQDLYAGRRNLRTIVAGYARRFADILSPTARRADCLLIEKELWPWAPAWLELLLLRDRAWVLDLDDAIFHNYDRHPRSLVRRLYGRKIDRLMRAATIVTAGSPYLAERARTAGARDVRVVPTAIDLAKYPAQVPPAREPRVNKDGRPALVIGWIGSPATVRYLDVVTSALREVAQHVDLTLRVIGAKAPTIDGVRTESVRWTDATEVAEICLFDVGIMPLIDSAWERGKCGYKLIQYMACGLPVVASPIGVNINLVEPDVNGLLASSTEEWTSALLSIALNLDKTRAFGIAGRRWVEQRYCTAVTSQAVLASLIDAYARQTGKGPADSTHNINEKS
jgi:glycosyltransferase involved in cell wall biosynthesis